MRLLALALVAILFASPGHAQNKTKSVSVEGTLVDMKCFSMDARNKGEDHMTPKGKMPGCATACAKMGIPVGVLQADGQVVVLIAPVNQISDHMAAHLRVTGTPALEGRGVIPDKVEVRGKDGKWKEIKIVTMM